MEEKRWSKGETYEKSKRISQEEKNTEQQMEQQHNPKYIQEIILQNKMNPNSEIFMKDTKRDGLNEQIGQRHMTEQTSMNPFRADNNYIDDLKNQDEFLRPQNTNQNI